MKKSRTGSPAGEALASPPPFAAQERHHQNEPALRKVQVKAVRGGSWYVRAC